MKILIVDDEAPAREYLRSLLEDLEVEVIEEACDGPDALAQAARFDLVLLDIRMPGMSGLEVAQALVGFQPAPRIIFVTAYDQHAVRAFELEAVDYLVKPVSPKRLTRALERVRQQPRPDLTRLLSHLTGKKLEKIALLDETRQVRLMVPWDEIIWVSSEKEKTYAVTDRGRLRAMETLTGLEAHLPDTFLRTHRSYLVNLDRVEQIQPWGNGAYNLVMRGYADPIPLSRSYAKAFKDRVNWA